VLSKQILDAIMQLPAWEEHKPTSWAFSCLTIGNTRWILHTVSEEKLEESVNYIQRFTKKVRIQSNWLSTHNENAVIELGNES
jgi:hypothetical protein